MIIKPARSGFSKVIRMSAKKLYVVILLLVIGCQQAGISADKATLPTSDPNVKTEPNKQLKINKDALLKGSSEQIRIDAATVILLSDDPSARKFLLDTLKQTENSASRMAICKALIQTRNAHESIKNTDDFIQPLLDILASDNVVEAKFAAEATLIFEYDQISKPLEKMATDASLPTKTRLNAVYALELQPDMKAVFKLISLLDNPNKEVASASENALRSLGIPVGKDAETRKQNLEELKHKRKDEFLRDCLIRQEARVRELETELNIWQGLYLSALGRIYDSISDETGKGNFLAEHLSSSNTTVKLWALEKAYQGRVGTTSRLPTELGPILINLISDPDKDVRLKTAKLLSLMGQLNSAQRLLKQLEVEADDEVKMELFVALGGACHYAFSPNADFKVPEETRKKTLEWAVKYLAEENPKKAQKGVEVTKKLLEQDGLNLSEVDRYLGLLVERYNQQKNKPEGVLQGELLSAMAGLCGQSAYKAEAAKRFAPLFEEALSDETDLVREAATDGLIYIDKTTALKRFRNGLVNDNNIAVRKKVIDLAGEVGGQEDLSWLAEKMGTTSEGEPAWQAMLKIFKHVDCVVIDEWITKFDSQSTKITLSDEQRISFLELAERKATSENRGKTLKVIRKKLARLYGKSGKYEQAAKYLGMMRETAQTAEEKEQILDSLLDVYLKWRNIKLATRLIANRLLEKDLEPNSATIRSIDNYLTELSSGTDPNAMLQSLAEIDIDTAARPMWHEQLKRWADHLEKTMEPNRPKE